MAENENIVIGDWSAIHLYLHSTCDFIKKGPDVVNPMDACPLTSEGLHAFNTQHPLYGNAPVDLLVPRQELRRKSNEICCHSVSFDLPPQAFYELRPNLHVASPELAFVRMGRRNLGIMQLAELGTNLCARYYTDLQGEIEDRPHFLTTPEKIEQFLDQVKGMDGSLKARKALSYIMANSGSPFETKSMLQFRTPCNRGGFNLPFDAMNFDCKAGRLARLLKQTDFCIDLANTKLKFGFEYDGRDSHDNPSKDKQRRNELVVLGWTIFPIDKSIIYDETATIRIAEQIARLMRVRVRYPKSWHSAFIQLRQELNLIR
ncbi:MAG: hypothetical protein IJI68_12140 [Eggerthellaceae bacterium]|nr:hypothetical protein [Eggerthellaceae bacterium]